CNTKVKFATLWERARAMGCAAVATGHYVRSQVDAVSGGVRLLKGRDAEKDQSYFLYDLTPEQLGAARFPVGHLTKGEGRALARRAKLRTADKDESQEICFVEPSLTAGDFVAREAPKMGLDLPAAPGSIADSSGRRIGQHAGHYRFTIGQRRGLGVAASERLYVLSLDARENRVVVGPAAELAAAEAELGGVRFLSGRAPREPVRAAAPVR